MSNKKKDRPLYQRVAIDIAGFGLIIISPLTGWLPGPGGIPIFLAGLGLVSLNHEWAENLLKNFEKKRQEFTDKVLMASPRISLTIDFASIALLCVGAYLAITQENILVRGLGLGTASLLLVLLLSNQKRFERIIGWMKSRRR